MTRYLSRHAYPNSDKSCYTVSIIHHMFAEMLFDQFALEAAPHSGPCNLPVQFCTPSLYCKQKQTINYVLRSPEQFIHYGRWGKIGWNSNWSEWFGAFTLYRNADSREVYFTKCWHRCVCKAWPVTGEGSTWVRSYHGSYQATSKTGQLRSSSKVRLKQSNFAWPS